MHNISRIIVFLISTALTFCGGGNADTEMTGRNEIRKDANAFSSGYADVNGLRMYHEIHGHGNPVVLIHGGGSGIATSFGRILPHLADSNLVIAVEMQAHGRTADINRPLSFASDADDIALLLDHLKIEKASIFGFSNGASTALHFAVRHPERTNKIIIASTFFKKSGAPAWFWEMMVKPTFEGMPQVYKDAFLAVNPDTQALRRMYERDVARMQSFTELTDAQIKSISCKALIIAGDKDVVTPEHLVEMHRLMPDSRLMIMPGGHGDYMGEITTHGNKEVVSGTAAVINRFLKEK
jgi:pimeloyl-ACP methyl ester carboxylesterase